MQPTIKAIIADDEEALRRMLKSLLDEVWPEVQICGQAANGIEALQQIETLRPDIAFLDIKMPGMSGMEVARQAADHCHIVFITAYDQFAVEAFESEAVDYLLKPVDPKRLQLTVNRLKNRLHEKHVNPDPVYAVLQQLQERLNVPPSTAYLKWIKVLDNQSIRLVPMDEIICFQAQDKYTVVLTLDQEFLIRKPIKELLEELDPEKFWQIHRSTIVNAACIDRVGTSLTGRYHLTLKNTKGMFIVSRSFRERFRSM